MTDSYANRVVSAGELILLNAGEYDSAFVAGLFRATVDLDFAELTARYAETITVGYPDFVAPELPPVAFGCDPYSSNPVERGFIAWIRDQGLVELVPTVAVRLEGSLRTSGGATLAAQVDQALDENDLWQTAGF